MVYTCDSCQTETEVPLDRITLDVVSSMGLSKFSMSREFCESCQTRLGITNLIDIRNACINKEQREISEPTLMEKFDDLLREIVTKVMEESK
jgi:hypothetical protein